MKDSLQCTGVPRQAVARNPLGRRTASALAIGLYLLTALPALAQFVPAEALASNNRQLTDPEFNQARGTFTWVDFSGNIWLGRIDKATGALNPLSGKATLIEKGAAATGGLGFTLNGPEWVYGAAGDRVAYTRFLPDLPQTPENARVTIATLRADGKWAKRTISPEVALNGPYGSESIDDLTPRITYNDAFGNRFWRELDDVTTEESLPGLPQDQFPVARFARGMRAAVYPSTVNGVDQAFRYNLDTKVFEQLTTDTGTKEQPWMWLAPEFKNQPVLMTTVGKSSLVLYRQGLDAANPSIWSRWHTIQAPLGGRFFSTEPFIYGGKSYVVMMVIVGSYPTSIWVANFDRKAPMLRRITPEAPDRARADPEIFFTDRGPIVFFGRYNPTKGTYWLCTACAEGLYVAETGIAPQ